MTHPSFVSFLINIPVLVLIFVFSLLLSCAFRCSCVVCSDLTSLIETHTPFLSSLSMFPLQKVRRPPAGRINYPGSHYTLNQGYQHVTQCFQKFSLSLFFKSRPLSLPLTIVYLDKGHNLNGKCLDLSLCYKRQG